MTTLKSAADGGALSVGGMSFFGAPLADWVQILAAVWLIVQIGTRLWETFRKKDKQ